MKYCCCNPKTLLLLLPLLLLSFFSTLPLVANSLPLLNITIGSSVNTFSSDDKRYWLSPSGNFAFGFYPVSCQKHKVESLQCYVVGIWNAASTNKTLVWVANRDDLPISDSSSIILTTAGIIIAGAVSGGFEGIAIQNNIQELVSYAMILDNGNLVLYNSDSRVMWESFNYPIDTILPGQTIKSGSSLVASTSTSDHSSGVYFLSVEKKGTVKVDSLYFIFRSIDKIYSAGHGVEHVEMNLDSNGHLYLVDQNGLNVKDLAKGENQTNNQNNSSLVMFRATLDSDGVLRLYREEKGSGKETSLQLTSKPFKRYIYVMMFLAIIFAFIFGLLLCEIVIIVAVRVTIFIKAKNQRTQGELELGTIRF